MLYVDTDILFMRPLDDIWHFLSEFNSTQVAAMTQEHEEPTASWYARFARHPYVPPYGELSMGNAIKRLGLDLTEAHVNLAVVVKMFFFYKKKLSVQIICIYIYI